MRSRIIVIYLLFVTQIAVSQAPYFQSYSLRRKNDPIQVNRILQDRAGFMWLATQQGLFRYDGLSFKQYTRRDSLPDDRVTALAEDSVGNLWMGHANGMVSVMTSSGIKKFVTHEGDAAAPVSDLLFDGQGVMWFGTQNDGLYYFKGDRLYRLDEEDGMPDIFIYDLDTDKKGTVWVATDGGIVRVSLDGHGAVLQSFSTDEGLPDNIVKKVVNVGDSLLLVTEDNGIGVFNPSTHLWKTVLPYQSNYGAITDCVVAAGQLWISTSLAGVVVYNQEERSKKNYSPTDDVDLSSILTVFGDREGNVWFGSKSGLKRCYRDDVEYLDVNNGLPSNNVAAITLDKGDQLWIGTRDGLYRQTRRQGKVEYDNALKGTPYQSLNVISLYTDSLGYIWAGLFGEGALRINPATGAVRQLKREICNGNVLNISGRGKEIWLATLGGCAKLTEDENGLSVANYNRKDGLISDYIYQVFIDRSGRVWFATDGKGVGMKDADGFHSYTTAFPSKVVYGFAEDGNGRIWANVQGEGLYYFEKNNFLPFHAMHTNGLRDGNIGAFTSTIDGNLIVMHDVGIDLIDTKNLDVREIGDEILLFGKHANLNTIARDSNGRIYVGADGGIVSCSGTMPPISVSPVTHIDQVKVLNQEIALPLLQDLPYDKNSVIVGFHGFWYQNPLSLNYRYRLDHYDQDWISTVDRSITYSSLPPGSYTLNIEASTTDDFRNAKVSTLHFVIHPPFWRTTIFYIAVFITVVLAVVTFVKGRERKLIRDNLLLERKVLERTEEINRKTEEINAQADMIKGINENLEKLVHERTRELEQKNKALEESAFIVAHELRAPVASLLGLINLISKTEMKGESREIVDRMDESAEKLNTIVRTITKAIERGDNKISNR